MAHLSMFVLAFILIAQGNATESIYSELYKFIISQSDGPHVPPVTTVGTPLSVGLQMGIIGITNVDRESNTVDLVFMVSALWNSNIMWDPANYNGLGLMSLNKQAIWGPQLAFRNLARVQDFGWHETVVMANGLTGGGYKYYATVFCDLSKGDKCGIELASAMYGNGVVSFQEPNTIAFNIEDSIGVMRHKASPYPITDSRNVKSELKLEGFPESADILTLEFSFKDPHRHHRHHHLH